MKLFFMSLFLLVAAQYNVQAQMLLEGLENHESPDTNYNYGVYKSASNSYWWTYIDCQNALSPNNINGKSLLLKAVTGSIESSQIQNGIASLNFTMNKSFPSTALRTFKVDIFSEAMNQTTTYSFSKDGTETDNEVFTVPSININGLFTIKIQNTTPSTAIVVDDITWESMPTNSTWEPQIWNQYLTDIPSSDLFNFSYAGYKNGDTPIPNNPTAILKNVTEFGAIANDQIDDTQAIQSTIDAVSNMGGGTVKIPVGKFILNSLGTKADYIKIPSNIIIQGSGSQENETVLFLADDITSSFGQGVLASKQDDFVSFPSINITQNAAKGTHFIALQSTANLNVGDVIRVRMYNPNVSGTRQNDLSLVQTAPLVPEPTWTNYIRFAPFECAFEIERIESNTLVKIKQPLMQDIETQWQPRAEKLNFITGIGIENLRMESDFAINYSHQLSQESDFGWCAIWLENVKDSWVKNVVINDFTYDLRLQNSMNVTIEDVIIDGNAGHHGIKIDNSWFCLAKDSYVKASRTHAIGVSEESHGNVFSTIAIETKNGMIDIHGSGFASHNLFEKINNSRVDSGGSQDNMPHSGQYNVFWNIIANTTQQNSIPNFDFFNGYYNYNAQINARGGTISNENYRLYPKSIMVGVYHPHQQIRVENATTDRNDDWLYNEGFNQTNATNPSSLYEAQFLNRINGTPLSILEIEQNLKEPVFYQKNNKLYTSTSLGITEFILYDLSGRSIIHQKRNLIKGGFIPLNINSGIYIISIKTLEKLSTQKIIIN